MIAAPVRPLEDLSTPAVLIDLDVLERNIARTDTACFWEPPAGWTDSRKSTAS
jgi:hypothetical protein